MLPLAQSSTLIRLKRPGCFTCLTNMNPGCGEEVYTRGDCNNLDDLYSIYEDPPHKALAEVVGWVYHHRYCVHRWKVSYAAFGKNFTRTAMCGRFISLLDAREMQTWMSA